MAWLKGAVAGGASAAIGELAGEFSGLISDAIVGGNSLGKAASIWTELGVSTSLSMAGNAIGQGITIGLGLQENFSGLLLAISGASAFTSKGLSIAKSGYLRDSRSAARQYLSAKQNGRFTSATGHDLYLERVRFYREGGYLSKQLPGYHISSKWGDNFNKVFNYNKSAYTFVHEMGHHFASTYDAGGTYNAYGFETYIMGNPNHIPADEGGVRWQLGRPVHVNWELQRMTTTPRTDIEYTNW